MRALPVQPIRSIALLAITALTATLTLSSVAHAEQRTAHDFAFTAIEGDPLPMAQFAGKPVLVVNTASRCGFTYQYDGLQALYDRYRDQGLVVLGVPSQDFRQELATSEDVKKFCEVNFGLDFPMTEIEKVRGDEAHPLFQWLAEQGATPKWNFNKFLIAPDGRFVARYDSSVKPESETLTKTVESVL